MINLFTLRINYSYNEQIYFRIIVHILKKNDKLYHICVYWAVLKNYDENEM